MSRSATRPAGGPAAHGGGGGGGGAGAGGGAPGGGGGGGGGGGHGWTRHGRRGDGAGLRLRDGLCGRHQRPQPQVEDGARAAEPDAENEGDPYQADREAEVRGEARGDAGDHPPGR